MTVSQAGAIAGPLVAGALIPVIGLEWLYLIDSFSLLATLGAVVRLPQPARRGRGVGYAGPAVGRRGLQLPAHAARC